jgi:hypothetical protein
VTALLDWIGFQLLLRLPLDIGCNPNHALGRWCLHRAGAWVYRMDELETERKQRDQTKG